MYSNKTGSAFGVVHLLILRYFCRCVLYKNFDSRKLNHPRTRKESLVLISELVKERLPNSTAEDTDSAVYFSLNDPSYHSGCTSLVPKNNCSH